MQGGAQDDTNELLFLVQSSQKKEKKKGVGQGVESLVLDFFVILTTSMPATTVE